MLSLHGILLHMYLVRLYHIIYSYSFILSLSKLCILNFLGRDSWGADLGHWPPGLWTPGPHASSLFWYERSPRWLPCGSGPPERHTAPKAQHTPLRFIVSVRAGDVDVMRLIRWPCSTSLYRMFLFAYFLKKKASRQYKSAFLVIDDDTTQPLLLLLLLLWLQLLVNNKILHFLMKMHDTTRAYLGILRQRHGMLQSNLPPSTVRGV